jgi:hypothetical protein
LLRTEKQKRQRAKVGFTSYRDNPIGFVDEVIGDFLWSKQREICQAMLVHRKVAVQACHGPGKSFLAARVAAWFITSSPPGEARAVTTAPTGDQVRGILWHEISAAHSKGRLPGKIKTTEWTLGGLQLAIGRKPNDYTPTAFQGYHALRMLVVLDEACGIPGSLWTAADSLCTTEESRMLAIGNPDDPASHFAIVCKPGSGWHVIRISAYDTPNFTDENVPEEIRARLTSPVWVEDKRKSWGEQSPLWQSKVLGEFPEEALDTLIPPGWWRRAVDRWAETEEDPEDVVELGCDIARFGSNETVIFKRQGQRGGVYGFLRQRDLMTVTGTIVRAIKDTGARYCKIDDTGLGGGVTDRLKELVSEGEFGFQEIDIIPVNVGNSPSDRDDKDERGASERFYDLKAELCWGLRELFEKGEIALEDDDDLAGQTVAIHYFMTSNGRLRIEGKEDMQKRRGLPSPDRFDALVLAYAPVQPRSLRAWEGML